MFRGVQSIEGRVVQVRIQTLHMLRWQLSRLSVANPVTDFIAQNPNMWLDTFGMRLGFQLPFQTMKPAPAIPESIQNPQ